LGGDLAVRSALRDEFGDLAFAAGERGRGVLSVRRLGAEQPCGARFAVRLHDGRTPRARRLLVATGLVDELPESFTSG